MQSGFCNTFAGWKHSYSESEPNKRGTMISYVNDKKLKDMSVYASDKKLKDMSKYANEKKGKILWAT